MMKAGRFHGKGDVRIEDIPLPIAEDGEILIDVEWCGICGSDLHEYVMGPLVIPTKDKPHHFTNDFLPITLGHEFVGKVRTGSEDGRFQKGQKVVVDPRLNCQSCHACKEGIDNVCLRWGFSGLSGGHGGGGFSETVAVNPRMCYDLPDETNLENAVIIEPLAVGRHALAISEIQDFGKLSILVLGGGPVGISTLYNLRAAGASKVFVSEPTAKRQERTRELASEVFNPLLVDVAEECRKRTDDRGVDMVFDCAGVPAAMTAGMDAVRRRGMYVNVAGWEQPFVIPMMFFMMKEIQLKASMAYDETDFRGVVEDFVAGRFKGAEEMITSRISLDDLKSKGFDELVTSRDLHCKIIATPRKELLGAG